LASYSPLLEAKAVGGFGVEGGDGESNMITEVDGLLSAKEKTRTSNKNIFIDVW
jgi:hypothetical protein